MAVIEDLVHLLPHEGGEAEDGRQEKQCLFHLQFAIFGDKTAPQRYTK